MPISRRLFVAGSAIAAATVSARAAFAAPARLTLIADTPNLYRDIFETGFERLSSSNPGLSVETIWTQDYTHTLQQSLRDKLVGRGPDVALHAHNNIAMLARRGDIVALNGNTAGDGTVRSEIGTIGGKQFAIPFSASVPVVYFNRDLTGSAGDLPPTWSDILSLAGKVSAPSGAAFFNYATDGSWTFMALIESLGGRIVTDDGADIAFDSAEGLEAMEILSDFAKLRKGQTLTASQARQAFASGALAIHVDTTSRLRFFEEQSKDRFRIGVMPFPVKDVTTARIPPSGGSLAIMANDPERQKSARALIDALLSRDVQSMIMAKTGFIPGLAVSGGLKQLEGSLRNLPHFEAIEPSLARIGPWASFPGDNPARIDKAVQDALVAQASLRLTAKETLARIVSEARNT